MIKRLDKGTAEILQGEKMLSPETYAKNKREQIKEYEEDIIYVQGQKDLLDTQREEAEKEVQTLNKSLGQVQDELDLLDQIRNKQCSQNETEELLIQLLQRKEEILKSKPTDEERQNIIDQIYELRIEMEKANLMIYESSNTSSIETSEEELKFFYNQYNEISSLLNDVAIGFECPTCFQRITNENITILKDSIKKRLADCIKTGKEMKSALVSQKAKEKSDFEDFKSKKLKIVEGLEAKIDERNKALEQVSANKEKMDAEHLRKLDEVNARIRSAEEQSESAIYAYCTKKIS